MQIQIIQVPYDSAHRAERTGRGPVYFVQQQIDETLRAHGWFTEVESIEAQRPFLAENYTAFELNRLLAESVQSARERGAFPLVLAGNCNSCLGTLSGSNPQDIGIIWFDAHGDFNTPDTSETGFFDGMGLSVATGHCWKKLAKSIPGFTPISEDRVILVGVRQLDDGETELLARSNVTLVKAEQVREQGVQASLENPLAALRTRVQRVYLHIDLDVLDPEIGRANVFAEPNGLFVQDVKQALSMIGQQFEIAAAAFTSYDPEVDSSKSVFQAAKQLMEHLLRIVEASTTQT